MAQASSSPQPVQQAQPPKPHGVLMTVLWDMP